MGSARQSAEVWVGGGGEHPLAGVGEGALHPRGEHAAARGGAALVPEEEDEDGLRHSERQEGGAFLWGLGFGD